MIDKIIWVIFIFTIGFMFGSLISQIRAVEKELENEKLKRENNKLKELLLKGKNRKGDNNE